MRNLRGLLIFLIGCVAVSCEKNLPAKKKGAPSKYFTLNINIDPPSLLPKDAVDLTSMTVLRMYLEGLTRMGPGDHVLPGMAEKWEHDATYTTYIFHLRKNNVWQNGSPVTAHDFKNSWISLIHSDNCPPEFYIIKNAHIRRDKKNSEIAIEVINNHTLKVELNSPAPYFLELVSLPNFFPTPPQGEKHIGNGPFEIIHHEKGKEILLKKSTTYWDASTVKLPYIRLLMVDGFEKELELFKKGVLDWLGDPGSIFPIKAKSAIKEEYLLHESELFGTYFYLFNTKKKPFDNQLVRRAFSLAINREELISKTLEAAQKPATGLVPKTMWNVPIYFSDHDIETAKKHIQESGVRLSDYNPFVISYNTLNINEDIALTVKEQWEKAFGIEVELEHKNLGDYLENLRKGNFTIARMGEFSGFDDPISSLMLFSGGENPRNYTKYESELFTEAIDLATKTANPEERLLLLKKAEKILMDEMPIAPLFNYTINYLKNPLIKGIYLSPTGYLDLKYGFWEYTE